MRQNESHQLTSVAAIFDFDLTLSPHYMQEPIFKFYGVAPNDFWGNCRLRSKCNKEAFGGTHYEIDYMSTLISYVKSGKFPGLSNNKLRELGDNIELYPGVEWFFNELFTLGVEIYIVSAGIRTMLLGLEDRIRLAVNNPEFKISGIYAGDFTEDEQGISEIANCVGSIDKVRYLYEISKGCALYGFDVTTSVPVGNRRIPFEQIIAIGDGPSDVLLWNLLKDSGGFTVGVFNPESRDQFQLIENIRKGNRLDIVATADYTPGSTASTWILQKSKELLDLSSEKNCIINKVTTLKHRNA